MEILGECAIFLAGVAVADAVHVFVHTIVKRTQIEFRTQTMYYMDSEDENRTVEATIDPDGRILFRKTFPREPYHNDELFEKDGYVMSKTEDGRDMLEFLKQQKKEDLQKWTYWKTYKKLSIPCLIYHVLTFRDSCPFPIRLE